MPGDDIQRKSPFKDDVYMGLESDSPSISDSTMEIVLGMVSEEKRDRCRSILKDLAGAESGDLP